jgi:FRG domain
VNELRVSTWAQLQEELFAGAWQEELARYRPTFAYRGRPDAAERLHTSLGRLGPEAPALETHILRAFRKYAVADAVPRDTAWNWLALGQHHGLPTRLLDWTFSPYVALHFVTSALDHADRDGAVWCIDYTGAHGELPDELRAVLAHEGADVFTTEMLDEVTPSIGDIERLGDFLLFVEPPSFDDRIVNQYALFSLLSRVETSPDDWVAAHPELARRIVVPAELKWEVRDKLDLANVTERVLFPGLDGLSRWLRRYYLPRSAG